MRINCANKKDTTLVIQLLILEEVFHQNFQEVSKVWVLTLYPPLSQYSSLLKNLRNNYCITDIPFVIEPGTAVVANCMHLVGNVYSINKKSNITYINTDLSRNLLGGLSQKVNFPMTIINTKSRKIRPKLVIKK